MPAHRKNYDTAVELYQRGLSVEDVANTVGITRQAMHTILRRRGVQFRPRERHGSENRFYRGGVVRNANFAVTTAITRGLLVVGPCEVCGLAPAIVRGRQRIHGHHDDYNKLLAVRWFCHRHHYEWHQTHKPIARSAAWTPTPHSEIAAMGGRAFISRQSPKALAERMAHVRAHRRRR